jgi:hypothetical protein
VLSLLGPKIAWKIGQRVAGDQRGRVDIIPRPTLISAWLMPQSMEELTDLSVFASR